ncbi:hypothetical protein LBMAG33_3010 [Candidatus Levyibacteriota bacterium]|nr:hypothetical protein [Candidatus Levybacteria bacterium]MSU25945.1 hypothetical protein [Candidatus Levybacteria bacterium]GDX61991.1 hypothetical protein LBMAG33_3010 [Candidatus Levybacteria bacterium]
MFTKEIGPRNGISIYESDKNMSVADFLKNILNESKIIDTREIVLEKKSFFDDFKRSNSFENLFSRYHNDSRVFRGKLFEKLIVFDLKKKYKSGLILGDEDLIFRTVMRLFYSDKNLEIIKNKHGDRYVHDDKFPVPDYILFSEDKDGNPLIDIFGEVTLGNADINDDRCKNNDYFQNKLNKYNNLKKYYPSKFSKFKIQFYLRKNHKYVKAYRDSKISDLIDLYEINTEFMNAPFSNKEFDNFLNKIYRNRNGI